MDAKHITPFIESTQRVFATMLGLKVTFGTPYVAESAPRHDVSGIIGMSGDVVGSVVLSFPTASARAIVAKFVGREVDSGGEDFADAVGELVNMISGAAKANFSGQSVSISCPSVVMGEKHKVAKPSDAVCVCIPCSCEAGEFAVDVAIRPAKSGAAALAA